MSANVYGEIYIIIIAISVMVTTLHVMEPESKSVSTLVWIGLWAVFAVLAVSRADAGERVQLEGIIKGAGCTHFKVECKNDDNHIALENDFVLVMPDGAGFDQRPYIVKGTAVGFKYRPVISYFSMADFLYKTIRGSCGFRH